VRPGPVPPLGAAVGVQGYGRNLWLVHGFSLANRGLRVLGAEARVPHAGVQGRPPVGSPRASAAGAPPSREGSSPAASGGLGARLERKGSLRVQAAGRWGPGVRGWGTRGAP